MSASTADILAHKAVAAYLGLTMLRQSIRRLQAKSQFDPVVSLKSSMLAFTRST